jgi:hypothetical protein
MYKRCLKLQAIISGWISGLCREGWLFICGWNNHYAIVNESLPVPSIYNTTLKKKPLTGFLGSNIYTNFSICRHAFPKPVTHLFHSFLKYLESTCYQPWKLFYHGRITTCSSFPPPSGAIAPCGPRPPHYRGFVVTLRHTQII